MTTPPPRTDRRPDRNAVAAPDRKASVAGEVRVAVIGAGVAGLAAARALHDRGLRVTVFDKARGPGGRTSTRRSPEGHFDHGAPLFTAQDPLFVREVRSWQRAGIVAPASLRVARWSSGEIHELEPPAGGWLSGIPGMNAACRHLARDLDLRLRDRITALVGSPGAWTLQGDQGRHGPFQLVVVAVPAPQAIALLAPAPELAGEAAKVPYEPCIAALLTLTAPPPLDWDVLVFDDGPVERAFRQRDDAGSSIGTRWVLHASARWSREHFEDDPTDSAARLLDAFRGLWAGDGPAVSQLAGHRWRYAMVARSLGEASLFDPASGIGACGDWCHDGGVEGAWLSGNALAGSILSGLRTPPGPAASEGRGRPHADG